MSGTQIPLRNIWLLFLYAADLARFEQARKVDAEPARDLPELLARLLVSVVQHRLRRNLSRGYQPRQVILPRVRGRIDVLQTAAGQLLERGRVACRFEEHTLDTPRNRLVRAALESLATRVEAKGVVRDCKAMSQWFGRLGVGSAKSSRAALAADQISRNESEDQLMVSLARMVFELLIPTEVDGSAHVMAPDTNVHLMRRLFEKAVGNALRLQLQPLGWQVRQGRELKWPVTGLSAEVAAFLPGMQTDIELEHRGQGRKLVIDTKFTDIFTSSQYREQMLRSGYLYQLYAYLRTQEERDDALWIQISEGMLLHPQCGPAVDTHIDMQGHRMYFRTLDLTGTAEEFERQLLSIGDCPAKKGVRVD